MKVQDIGRRSLMGSAMATAALSAVTGPVGARPVGKPLDPTDPKDIALIYRKLAFSMDEKPGYWWLQGRRFGLVDAELTPLWDMHVGTFFRTRDVADSDAFDVTLWSVSFYTDIDSGQYITSARNPYTGKEVAIQYFRPTAGTVRYNSKGRMDSGPAPAGLIRDGAIGPAWIEGDQVLVQGDYIARRDEAPGADRIRVNDLATYYGSKHQIADTFVASAPAGQIFSDINTWPDWLGMGGRPGSYFSRAHGRKASAYELMPSRFRDLMSRLYPDIARHPAESLNG
jgi:hypothetical protein